MATNNYSGRSAVRLLDKSKKSRALTQEDIADSRGDESRSKRGDDVRLRIMNAALDYFGALGFEGTTTRAIAERAEVTHSLVIYHFGNKEKLWMETLELALSPYSDGIARVSDRLDTAAPDVLLRNLIEMFVRIHAIRPQIHRFMTMEGNQENDRMNWIIESFVEGHYSLWRELIRRGQDEGRVRICDPARLYYMIISTGGTLFSLPHEYKTLTGRDIFSEAEILRNIAFLYELVFIDPDE